MKQKANNCFQPLKQALEGKKDINPLIIDLNKFKDELSDLILIAIGLRELNKADLFLPMILQKLKENYIQLIHFVR